MERSNEGRAKLLSEVWTFPLSFYTCFSDRSTGAGARVANSATTRKEDRAVPSTGTFPRKTAAPAVRILARRASEEHAMPRGWGTVRRPCPRPRPARLGHGLLTVPPAATGGLPLQE